MSVQEIIYRNSEGWTWQYFREAVLDTPEAGLVVVLIIVLYLCWQLRATGLTMPKNAWELSQEQNRKRLNRIILEAMQESVNQVQTDAVISQIKEWQGSLPAEKERSKVGKSKLEDFKQLKHIFGNIKKESIIYETRDEREQRMCEERERMNKQQKEERDRLDKLQKEERDRVEKQRKKLEQKQKAEAEKKKQMAVVQESSVKTDNTVSPVAANKEPMFPTFSAAAFPKIGNQNSVKTEDKPAPLPKVTVPQPIPDVKAPVERPLVSNVPLFQAQPPKSSSEIPIIVPKEAAPIIAPKKDIPVPAQPIAPYVPAARPNLPLQAANVNLDFSSEQFLQTLTNFGDRVSINAEITTTMSNLGGARSSLNDLLIFSKSFIDTINKEDDKQVTAFAIKVYDSIVHKLISNSNLKDGLERMPPKSKTNQVEKNSINCYILIVNIYRLMGYEKVWTIVFAKTLKLLQFIFKRKQDLAGFKQLDLITNKYIDLRGDLSGKYLSRIDYLSYLLFGLTAFDPLLIFAQVEQKERDVVKSREEMQSWGGRWSYKQFWILSDAFFKNRHDSYFKPIVYMNLLAVLYPRVYEHKCNSNAFERENELYKIVLDLGKQYFARYRAIKEIEVLSEEAEGSHEGYHYEYDGEDFKQGIKVLENRITVEKAGEFKLGGREFDAKANIFYYFSKEK